MAESWPAEAAETPDSHTFSEPDPWHTLSNAHLLGGPSTEDPCLLTQLCRSLSTLLPKHSYKTTSTSHAHLLEDPMLVYLACLCS